MKKQLVICVSPYKHKYYFEPTFSDIPEAIQQEVTSNIATLADKVKAIISLGFYEDGTIYIEQTAEDGFDDEIGIALEVKKFERENSEMFRSMRMWYMIYRTEQGKYVKAIVLYQSQGMSNEQVIQKMREQYGEEAGQFTIEILE